MSINSGGPWWDAPSKSGLGKNITLRSPDAIKLVTVGEEIYIITANEVSRLEHNIYPFILRHHII